MSKAVSNLNKESETENIKEQKKEEEKDEKPKMLYLRKEYGHIGM